MKAAPTRVNPPFDFAPDKVAGPRRAAHVAHMTGKDKELDERLAAALRENLRRRKTQSRELAAEEKEKKS